MESESSEGSKETLAESDQHSEKSELTEEAEASEYEDLCDPGTYSPAELPPKAEKEISTYGLEEILSGKTHEIPCREQEKTRWEKFNHFVYYQFIDGGSHPL